MNVSIDENKWTRRMLNYLWAAVTAAILSPVINMLFTEFDSPYFLIYRVVLPAAVVIFIMLLTEFLVKKLPRYKDYIIILHSMLIALSLIFIHDTIPMILLSLFLLPIFMATITFRQRKISFALMISLSAFFGLLLWYRPFQMFNEIMTINFLLIILSVYYLSIQITGKGKELIRKLETALENEKELFLKNVVMEKMSKIDLPTDLYNHKTFHEYLDPLMNQLTHRDFSLQLALLDLDDFKSVNDVYGHSTGDLVIKKTADLIKEHLGSDDFGARYGGEEFAIIFTDKKPEEVHILLESLRTSMSRHAFKEMEGRPVTISIGVANALPGEAKDTLFKRADEYLYQAKQQGKNRICNEISSPTPYSVTSAP